MGVQDRDWYREELRRKEGLYYNPKAYRRPGPSGTPAGSPQAGSPRRYRNVVLACVAAMCLVLAMQQWRRHDQETRRQAAWATQQQQLKLQALERERLAKAEEEKLQRLRQEESKRIQAAAVQREAEKRAFDGADDEAKRREKLWEQFYKPAPGCERSATVECANAFIRARRRFNDVYPS